jgi:hypothetical protein
MNAVDFDHLFDGAFTEWSLDVAQSPTALCFPVAVVERLKASSIAPQAYSSRS